MSIMQLNGPTTIPLNSRDNAAGPPTQPAKSAAASQPGATTIERETAIAALRNGADIQLEWLQAILDGVTVAVIQTQDITALAQAVKLENANRVTVTSLLCDAVLFLVLDFVGELVKKTVVELAEQTTTAFLSTNTAFRLLPLSDEGRQLTSDKIQSALNTIGKESANGKKWGIYSDAVCNAATKASDKAADALADLTKEKLGGGGGEGFSFGPKEAVEDTDQPRTAITRSIQSYVSMHRLALRLQLNNLEAGIRAGPYTGPQLKQLISSLALKAPPDDLDTLRSNYSLLIEACIWAKVYRMESGNPVDRVYHAGGKDTGDGNLPGGGNIKGVPSVIVQYWWSRFAGLGNVPHGEGVGQSNEIAKMFLEIGGNLNEAFKQLSDSPVMSVSQQK